MNRNKKLIAFFVLFSVICSTYGQSNAKDPVPAPASAPVGDGSKAIAKPDEVPKSTNLTKNATENPVPASNINATSTPGSQNVVPATKNDSIIPPVANPVPQQPSANTPSQPNPPAQPAPPTQPIIPPHPNTPAQPNPPPPVTPAVQPPPPAQIANTTSPTNSTKDKPAPVPVQGNCTLVKNTTEAVKAPPPVPDRSFDGMSFIGGMVLAVGVMAIGVVAFQFYRSRADNPNYLTL